MSRYALFLIFPFLLSCSLESKISFIQQESRGDRTLKISTHFDTSSCNLKEETRRCYDFNLCFNFCKTIYGDDEKGRKFCEKWPVSFYERFQPIFSQIHALKPDQIKFEDLSCLIDISEEDISFFTKFMGSEQASYFLKEIAKNPEFARNLRKKDDKMSSILKELLEIASDSKHQNTFIRDLPHIKDRFLLMIDESENREAWKWLNDYLYHTCKEDRSCDHTFELYCEAFKDLDSLEIKEILEESFLFEGEFERYITSKDCDGESCEYGSFRDFRQICGRL